MTDYLTLYTVSLIATGFALMLSIVMGFVTAKERSRLPLATTYDKLEKMIIDRETQLSEAEVKLEQLREKCGCAAQTIAEGERQQNWLATNQELLASVRQQRDEQVCLIANLQQLTDANAKAEQRAFELTAAANKAELERDAAADRLKTLMEQAENLATEHAATVKSLETLKRDSEVLSRRLELGSIELANAEQSIEQAKKQKTELAAAVAASRRELGEIQEQHEQISVKCAGLRTEYQCLEKQLVDIREQIKLALTQQNTISPAAANLETRIADLWNPVLNAALFTAPLSKPVEQERLHAVGQELERMGFRFHKRVITALHTSLKTSKDSPLLVLAGISGTGKSLLPRRYAEAMGMHELTVPVQPRWDSPQDLLGFYNHLQGKFVPTELVRALVQMDPYGKLPTRGWPKRPDTFIPQDDRMLLVLLDEMNLARVEYYFSDFLSLLENRRDIQDFSDVDRRIKAEISLETGPTSGQQGGFRLFVDTNVLFVGTMNEDESTQTLSDKVIDRANVMRFAAPKTFQSTGKKESAVLTSTQGQQKFLSFGDWKRWLKTPGSGNGNSSMNTIDGQINELSVAMRSVGRPFGHRVQRAIKGYVEQYPDESPEGLHNAMADQIEQRILPKLRGIELSSNSAKTAVTKVLAVIKQLNDEPLLKAVEDGRRDGHQFNWPGIDRENA